MLWDRYAYRLGKIIVRGEEKVQAIAVLWLDEIIEGDVHKGLQHRRVVLLNRLRYQGVGEEKEREERERGRIEGTERER